MSAEILRQAVVLMRERAEASKTAFGYGPWRVDGLDEYGHYVVVPKVQVGLGSRVAADLTEDDAEHIASWHPAVALAVAEVLAFTAETWSDDRCDSSRGWDETCGECVNCTRHWAQVRALAVARAYLGEQA